MSGVNVTPFDDSTVFAVDFNPYESPSVSLLFDSITLGGANVSISDSSGNLAFYTNGCLIRDKLGGNMQNGDFINLGPNSDVYTNYCGIPSKSPGKPLIKT